MPRCAVYRHFNKAGKLLYVGIAKRVGERTNQHRLKSPWYPKSIRMDVRWFGSVAAAIAEEQRAILMEDPICNAAGGTFGKICNESLAAFLGIGKFEMGEWIGELGEQEAWGHLASLRSFARETARMDALARC